MFYIGIDLGQRRDHTAVAVVERMELYQAFQAPELHHLQVRYLERVPLGMSYPAVVERVRAVSRAVGKEGPFTFVVDATGVGAPVVDLMRAGRLGGEIVPVTITGGDKAVQTLTGWNVPKTDLMAGLQVLLEKEQLRVAKGLRDAGALMKELMDVRAVTRGPGSLRVGADGDGQHDDLVIALALGCWRAKSVRNLYGTRRLI